MTATACVPRPATSLSALLAAHARAESRQTRIDRLRARALRLATRRAEARALADTDPLIDALLADRAAPRVAPLPPGFSDFRRAMSLLHRSGQADGPVAARRIAGNLSPRDTTRIEALEAAAARAADTLSGIEAEVLDTPPATLAEATAKLRFLSSLMLTGGSLEVDYFAWLVDECARIIDAGLA
jgi:hypothetical protein